MADEGAIEKLSEEVRDSVDDMADTLESMADALEEIACLVTEKI
jgi:hypothetical protein